MVGLAMISASLNASNASSAVSVTTVSMRQPSTFSGWVGASEFTSMKSLVLFGQKNHLFPALGLLLGGLVVWRGRVRQRWECVGLDEDLFVLFVKTKGAETRIELLESLTSSDKDRFQLSHQLNLAWRAVDRQITILVEHGLVHERVAYGQVKIYGITQLGKRLLKNLRETMSARYGD
jgi:predicted transcriptional regulator